MKDQSNDRSEPQNMKDESDETKGRWTMKRKLFATPKTVSQEVLVQGLMNSEYSLPLKLEPAVEGIRLADWAANNLPLIKKNLLIHGAILFRNFRISSQEVFEEFLSSISAKLMLYTEGATPRTELGNRIYTSTEFPSHQRIALHNELSYAKNWPQRLWFCCITPAKEGGETPIADVRKVLERIDPEVQASFFRKKWMLVRNFAPGMGLSWQESFHTNDPSQVETYCRSAGISFEWIEKDHLRTSQICPAMTRHPDTDEWLWFNHLAFWHISSVCSDVRDALRHASAAQGLPFNTYYGDGSPIEPAVIQHICSAYDSETRTFSWQCGDLLMLDNMLVAHGRNPYKGDRKLLVSMGEPVTG